MPIPSIEEIVEDTLTLLKQIEDIPQMGGPSLNRHKRICQGIPEKIRTGCLNIAVVGVMKSGKSTFVNSIVGRELVKRGAGAMTSIATRIRKGKKNQARVYFKSWDQINSQLQNALVLYPDDDTGSEVTNPVDIRRKKDRDYLETVYQQLISDSPVTENSIRPETLLIRHALNGFADCQKRVQADETTICYDAKAFDHHKDYTSDPNKAFYVKDVCLDIYGKVMAPNIEIADCQGADSTDPAQLAQILSYLESSNLIIYCISSRAGLRQSDMTFLKRIQNIGLLENIIFINNCDLSEHENLDDLIKIETGIRQNLEFFEIEPKVFSFSTLYNLFQTIESKLTKRDVNRLRFWREEKEMVQYCDEKTRSFTSFFKEVIEKNRQRLLISNHLNRLDMILSQLDREIDIFLGLLSSDKQKENTAIQALDTLEQNASRLESIVANSLNGAVNGLEEEVTNRLRDIFSRDQALILKQTQEFIKQMPIDVEQYRSTIKTSGFKQILYFMFQEFKRNLDVYGLETVQPRLKRMVKTQEDRITAYFQSLFDSYQIDLLKGEPYSEFDTVSKMVQDPDDRIEPIEIDKIKKLLGLCLPSVLFEAQYTTRIKANVFTGFSLRTLIDIFYSLLSRRAGVSFSSNLNKAAQKIKKENLKVIGDQFDRYHHTLRTQYFAPLIAAATRDFKEKINERFSRYRSLKQEIEHVLSLKKSEKQNQKNNVLSIKKHLQTIAGNIALHSDVPLE